MADAADYARVAGSGHADGLTTTKICDDIADDDAGLFRHRRLVSGARPPKREPPYTRHYSSYRRRAAISHSQPRKSFVEAQEMAASADS